MSEPTITTPARGNDRRIIGYKAFDPDFKCRGFQYEVGKTFEHEGKIELYSEGFHFCNNNPLDAFDHYQLVDREDARPIRLAKISATKKDTIVSLTGNACVTSKISIDKEITLDELIKEQVEKACNSKGKSGGRAKLLIATKCGLALTDKKTYTRIISDNEDTRVALTHDRSMALATETPSCLASCGIYTKLFATGGFACLSSSGYGAGIYNSGFLPSTSASGARSTLRITGDQASVTSSGAESALYVSSIKASVASSGTYSKLRIIGDQTSVASSGGASTLYISGIKASVATSGARSTLRITGDQASVATSGSQSTLTVTGKSARMTVVGNDSLVTYEGKGGVISVLGIDAKFKGSKGTLVLAATYNCRGEPTGGLVGRIGEDGLKPDTLYTVRDGKFVEVEAQ